MTTSTFSKLIITAAVLVLLWVVSTYNKLIRLIEAVNNNKKQIDIILDARGKTYESLIEVVNQYMNYEETVLKDVVALRNQSHKAGEQNLEKDRMAAEDAISKIGSGLNVVFERYPDLKANQNCMQLQETIVNIESKLAFAKQAYNYSIEIYNAKKKSLMESFLVGLLPGRLNKEFEYWGVSDEKRKEAEDYRVQMDRK